MCGISGLVMNDPKAQPAPEVLRRMNQALAHRGPDEEGVVIRGPAGLGIRRLRIIDLETGSQPISDESRTKWVVLNGEIYNYRELRRETEKTGHTYVSRSDTEVLVHLYEDKGESFVHHLQGMYGIALWDEAAQKLVLVRDRLGIKPLYYALRPEGLYFASELKALIAVGLPREMDYKALSHYLSFNYVPGELSIFRQARKLLPGHILVYCNGTLDVRRYWEVPLPDPSAKTESEEDAQESLKALLREAVASHMISDVPLGVFLSGGVDSGAITAFACEAAGKPVKTFSVGFDQKSFNELNDARRTAEVFATEHHEIIVRPKPEEILPKLFRIFDEPFADSSAIPMYYICELARQFVTVCLGGEGGDEVFGGYHTYVATQLARQYQRLPAWLTHRLIPAIVNRLPVSHERVSFDYRAKRFARGAILPLPRAHYSWKAIFDGAEKDALLRPEIRQAVHAVQAEDAFESVSEYFQRAAHADLISQLQYVDLMHYLPDNNLTRCDRTSMAVALEVRVPLLDHRIVEWMMRQPPERRVRGLSKKHLLKRVLADRLPDRVLRGRKRGFNVPIPAWLNHELRPMMTDLLAPSTILRQGFFNVDVVNRLVREHLELKADHSRALWGLIMFSGWWNTYVQTT
jgi:asparagine synthase (glutamine-hydrolysing)